MHSQPEALKPEALSHFTDIELLQMIIDITLNSSTTSEIMPQIKIIARELDRRDYEFET